eukprot:9686862-Alexandrium_andersonii.AAC.1
MACASGYPQRGVPAEVPSLSQACDAPPPPNPKGAERSWAPTLEPKWLRTGGPVVRRAFSVPLGPATHEVSSGCQEW